MAKRKPKPPVAKEEKYYTLDEIIEILENEKECVIRARECDRDCAKCDLVRPEEDILEAYECAILSIQLAKMTTKGLGLGV